MGEALQLPVGHSVESSDGCGELDIGVGEGVGATLFGPVHGLQLFLIALHEDEL